MYNHIFVKFFKQFLNNIYPCQKWAHNRSVTQWKPLSNAPLPLLKAYANLLDPAAGPTCPLCKEGQQAMKHWLQKYPYLDVENELVVGAWSNLVTAWDFHVV